jgi:hypothetical protein
MTRKTTQWPKVARGDYARWCKEFDQGPFVRRLLAKIAPLKAEQIRTLLFVAQLGPRQLTREQVRRIWPQLNTRINLTDYVIACLVAELKEKTRSVNEDTAALLTAAGIPGGRPGVLGWSAEGIKKRRASARNRLLVSVVGPRFVLKRLSVTLLTARETEKMSGKSLIDRHVPRDKNTR